MLDRGGAVAALSLTRLIRLPATLHRQHCQLLTPIGEQQLVAHSNRSVIGVEDDRQAKQQAAGGAVARHHGFVVLLMHEATQGREPSHHKQLNVAGIAIAALDPAAHPS